jgi:hypothetical protein
VGYGQALGTDRIAQLGGLFFLEKLKSYDHFLDFQPAGWFDQYPLAATAERQRVTRAGKRRVK